MSEADREYARRVSLNKAVKRQAQVTAARRSEEVKIRARNAAWVKQRDGVTDEREQYAAQSLAKQRVYNVKRRAVMAHAVPGWSDPIAVEAIYTQAARLTLTSGVQHDVDHVVPLMAATVCGLHCEANLLAIPHADNVKKGNRHWPCMP